MNLLNKYSIFLFLSSSIEKFKINQYKTFQRILLICFHFMRSFVIASSPECLIHVDCCIVYLLKLTFKIENARNIHIFLKVS